MMWANEIKNTETGMTPTTLHLSFHLKRRTLRVAAGLLPWLFATAVQAQAYPNKPIKLVVPYPPGGATDVIGRVLAQKLSVSLGQQVVVDNRAGAGGNVGAGQVAKAPADGYTLLMGAMTSHAINAALNPQGTPFDLQKSFAPIAVVGSVPLAFVVNPAVKANNLGELMALAKANPGALSFGSAGNGSPQHLSIEMFKRMADVNVVHVPYRGSGPAMTDLIGGQIQAMIETAPAAQAQVKAGKIRALATTTTLPVASLPGVPTATQAGLKGFEVSSMFGLAAPAGTPVEVVARINQDLKKILAEPEVVESLLAQGAVASYTTPEDASKMIAAEHAKWAQVIKDGNIKPE
jgi:tripartite-type tricarboxylate transporter receptor subunit TctC